MELYVCKDFGKPIKQLASCRNAVAMELMRREVLRRAANDPVVEGVPFHVPLLYLSLDILFSYLFSW